MADEEDEIQADPEFLYNLHGSFDQNSYDDDIKQFPDYFDENGWPLFGEYEPYALTHPITGLAWHKAPREPRDKEDSQNYNHWYYLACSYSLLSDQITSLAKSTPIDPRDDAGTSNAVYKSGARPAFAGDLKYCRENLIPELNAAFSLRRATPGFLVHWGEFCSIAESLGASANLSKSRNAGRNAPQSPKREAQRKWYLHWVRHHTEYLGLSVTKANQSFVDVAFDIVKRKLEMPEGFDIGWFSAALKSENSAEHSGPVRDLPAFLRRPRTDDISRCLLAQNADEEPNIPPICQENFNGFGRKAE